jgi:hypothetical protein
VTHYNGIYDDSSAAAATTTKEGKKKSPSCSRDPIALSSRETEAERISYVDYVVGYGHRLELVGLCPVQL